METRKSNNTLTFKNWNIEAVTGYKPKTTYYMDFSIADAYGLKAIQDTYNRAFKGAKTLGYVYITELVMVLNWKIWEHYQTNKQAYANLYNKLFYELDAWAYDNLKDEALTYYIRTTD